MFKRGWLAAAVCCLFISSSGDAGFRRGVRNRDLARTTAAHLVTSNGYPVGEGSVSFTFTPSTDTPTGFAIDCETGTNGWQIEIGSWIRFHGINTETVTTSSLTWVESQAYEIALVWENPTGHPTDWDLTFYRDGVEIDSGSISEITAIPARCGIAKKIAGTSPVSGTIETICASTTTTTCLEAKPTTTSVAASDVATTSVQLNGRAKPNGIATTGWFRYDTSDPGSCDDTFGIRVPGSGGTALGSGSSAQTFNEDVTGLIDNTTYYYCAIAENTEGKTYGSVLSFTTVNIPPEIEFLAAGSSSGLGTFGTASFCSNFSAYLTGSQAWCYDGTNSGLTLSAVGAPTTATEAECPNGIDCSTVARLRQPGYSSGSEIGYKTADQAELTSDFGCFVAYRASNSAGVARLLYKGSSAATRQVRMDVDNTGGVTGAFVKAGPATITLSASSNLVVGDLGFVVLTVDQGTSDSDSNAVRLYVNDMSTAANSDTTTVAGGTMLVGNHAWRIGHEVSQSGAAADILIAGCTGTFLDSTKRLEMKNYALGVLKDTTGAVTMTTTRAVSSDCASSDGTRQTSTGPNRACVTGDGSGNARLRAWAAVSNIALQSDTFENASWGKINNGFAAPVVTANQAVGPDGNKTADQVAFPAISPNAANYSLLRQRVTGVANDPYSFGVWMRMSAGTGKVYLSQKYASGGSYQTTTCNLTTTWSFCKNENYTGVVGTDFHDVLIGFDNADPAQNVDTLGAQTIYIAKAQWNRTRRMAQYCTTTTASRTCSSHQHSFPTPAGISDTAGCMGATFTAQTTAAATTQKLIQFASGGYLGYDNDELICNDGTNTASLAITDPVDTEIRAVCTWTGTTLTVKKVGGSSATATYDGAIKGATTYVGHNGAAANVVNGWIRQVMVDDLTYGCE